MTDPNRIPHGAAFEPPLGEVTNPVDLVKWEQEPEPRRLSWDPAADLLDEAAAEMALIVHSGWGAGFLAALDEAEGCDDLLAALDGEAS